MEYVVTGIGTDVGKTLVSAILCEALNANYWKPVQTGTIASSDALTVGEVIGQSRVFPNAYAFREPLSPHAAAELEGQEISTARLQIPISSEPLIIEGAGGVHVPLNWKQTLLDLMQVWDIPVIVVSRNYLGSINHTLLTLEVLQQRGIPIAGVVFNGDPTPMTEQAIANYSRITVLGHVPTFASCTPEVLRRFAADWRPELLRKLNERHPLNVDIERKKRLLFGKKESHPRAAFS